MDRLFRVLAVSNLPVSRREPQKGPLRKSLIFIPTLVEGKIKMQQEEATRLNCHICHLWRKDGCVDYLGGTKVCDPSGVFSPSQSVLGQPQEGLQIGSRCWVRLIGGIQMAAI